MLRDAVAQLKQDGACAKDHGDDNLSMTDAGSNSINPVSDQAVQVKFMVADDSMSLAQCLGKFLEYWAAPATTGITGRNEDAPPAYLLMDVRLPGTIDADLHRAFRGANLPPTVLCMIGHERISMALASAVNRTFDFIQTSGTPVDLLDGVRRALEQSARHRDMQAEITESRKRFESLTQREKEVMRLLVEGGSTKIVARRLGLSPRTVETHRARIMAKMRASTISALVRQGVVLEWG